jgi:hypothetical protein
MKSITAGDVQNMPAESVARTKPAQVVGQDKLRLLRQAIWLYIILWLIEGGLRRWFLPGLASPLLLIRDPLAIGIYFLAASNGLFPMNGFITWGAILGALSVANALVLGHGNAFVAVYGARCDFLHVPLIFVIGRVLRHKDLVKMAKISLIISIPFSALLLAQYYQPQDAWVNRGVGGDMAGAGFDGANGHFRPPGTFSFITGPSLLYPMFTACWFALLLLRKLPLWLMMSSGAAILIAVPFSISRTLFLNVVVVAMAGVGAMITGGRLSGKIIVQFAVAALTLFIVSTQSATFKDGMETFSARWETATTDNGGFKEAIVDRMLEDLVGNLGGVQAYGMGTGFSTNVGQQSLTAKLGFGGSEGEWGRLLYDNGWILGGMLVAYRVALALSVAFASFRAWKRHSTISLVFAATCFQMLVHGHWGQTTTLGAVVIGAGLTLAFARDSGNDSKKRVEIKSAGRLQTGPAR